jgi:hypothetical protein
VWLRKWVFMGAGVFTRAIIGQVSLPDPILPEIYRGEDQKHGLGRGSTYFKFLYWLKNPGKDVAKVAGAELTSKLGGV